MRKPLQHADIEAIFRNFFGGHPNNKLEQAVSDMRNFFEKNKVRQLTFASLASIAVEMANPQGAGFWAKVFRKALGENELRSLRRRLASRDISNKNVIIGLLKNPKDKSATPSRVVNLLTPDRRVVENDKPNNNEKNIYGRMLRELTT